MIATVPRDNGGPTQTLALLSGIVSFKDRAAIIGTGTLANGVATFTTATLAQGSHPISAVYGGDASFATSTSVVLTQVVNPAGGPPPTTGLRLCTDRHPGERPIARSITSHMDRFEWAPTLLKRNMLLPMRSEPAIIQSLVSRSDGIHTIDSFRSIMVYLLPQDHIHAVAASRHTAFAKARSFAIPGNL